VDAARRRTLILIETVAVTLAVGDGGRQLLHVARDYVDDGDVLSARSALTKIKNNYFDEYLPRQIVEDKALAEALAVVVGVFGSDLVFICRPVDTV
jgi:hypothetical protein